jgi:hypothetical protein
MNETYRSLDSTPNGRHRPGKLICLASQRSRSSRGDSFRTYENLAFFAGRQSRCSVHGIDESQLWRNLDVAHQKQRWPPPSCDFKRKTYLKAA